MCPGLGVWLCCWFVYQTHALDGAFEDFGDSHFNDPTLAEQLVRLFNGATVADFGAGWGFYVQELNKAAPNSARGFDGTPNVFFLTGGVVEERNLVGDLNDLPLFDWVLSLEVGEHIPAQFEAKFLDSLAHHAKKGIVLSWAIQNQPGRDHVNCHSNNYIVRQMQRRGFNLHLDLSSWLRKTSTLLWFKDTIMVFERRRLTLPSFSHYEPYIHNLETTP
jgi:2-polyprenyl-3-methyl-5-hydroxy-6-metoxy-1,4-benzoquinol methylase